MFKNILFLLSCTWLLISSSVIAKTPDTITPSQESVCDLLKLPDVTQGLYGLCVAYCEAHDAHLESLTGEAAQLSKQNEQILKNYRKKMKAGDPDMPCVSKGPECPCWENSANYVLNAYYNHEIDLGVTLPYRNTVNRILAPSFSYTYDLYFRLLPSFSNTSPQLAIDFISRYTPSSNQFVCATNHVANGTVKTVEVNFVSGANAFNTYQNCNKILNDVGTITGAIVPFPAGFTVN